MENRLNEKLSDLLQVIARGLMDIGAELSNPPLERPEAGSDAPLAVAELRPAPDPLEAASAEQDRLAEEIGRWEDDLRAVGEELDITKQKLEQAQKDLAETQLLADEARAFTSATQELQLEAEQTRARLEAHALELEARELALGEREERFADEQNEYSKSSDWMKSLLPKWREAEDLVSTYSALIEDVKALGSQQSVSAGLLASLLAGYSFALRDPDDRNLADFIRDVGRRLFGWLRARGVDDYQAAELAKTVAEYLNRECAGRCEVEVPTPGGPPQAQTMAYLPSGNAELSVAAVQSWCVRGPKREVIHRAAITF